MINTEYPPEIKASIAAYQSFVAGVEDWPALIEGVEPKATGCGPVYELANPLGRTSESFAVADMRSVEYAHPHYHANGEVEIYFVLQGLGRVVVGNEIRDVQQGSIVVTPAGVTHYALPDKVQGLVLAVVNTPPFSLANNVELAETDIVHGYDHELFGRLARAAGTMG
jgi:mannose-6-phosphate isomerase-like protein (cupin superfamily)